MLKKSCLGVLNNRRYVTMTMKTSLMEGGGIEMSTTVAFRIYSNALLSFHFCIYLPLDTATLGPPLVGFKVCNSLNVEATLL